MQALNNSTSRGERLQILVSPAEAQQDDFENDSINRHFEEAADGLPTEVHICYDRYAKGFDWGYPASHRGRAFIEGDGGSVITIYTRGLPCFVPQEAIIPPHESVDFPGGIAACTLYNCGKSRVL